MKKKGEKYETPAVRLESIADIESHMDMDDVSKFGGLSETNLGDKLGVMEQLEEMSESVQDRVMS